MGGSRILETWCMDDCYVLKCGTVTLSCKRVRRFFIVFFVVFYEVWGGLQKRGILLEPPLYYQIHQVFVNPIPVSPEP